MGILLYINPILNFIAAAVIFNEPTETLQIIGYTAIFISIVIFNWVRIKSMLS
jgi:chloramphenicol-sensitive protein RarD